MEVRCDTLQHLLMSVTSELSLQISTAPLFCPGLMQGPSRASLFLLFYCFIDNTVDMAASHLNP